MHLEFLLTKIKNILIKKESISFCLKWISAIFEAKKQISSFIKKNLLDALQKLLNDNQQSEFLLPSEKADIQKTFSLISSLFS